METLKFTDRWLKSLRPSPERLEFADLLCPGLRLRVGARGASWSVMIRTAKGRKRISLGTYPATGLMDARQLASDKAENQINPEKTGPRLGTLQELCQLCIDQMRKEEKASADHYKFYLLDGPASAVEVIGKDEDGKEIQAKDITPTDVTQWLRTIHERGTQVRLPRAYLHAAFARGMKADFDPTNPNPDITFGLEQNPVTNVGGNTASGTRDRHLDIKELSRFWHGFSGRRVHPQMKLLLRMIICMGGVRITEIVRAEKAWWTIRDGQPWLELPKTKNNHPHDLPLPKAAHAVLKALDMINHPGSAYMFSSPVDPEQAQTLTGISKAVRRWCDDNNFERFQPRDIRRTMKTLLIDRNPGMDRDWIDAWHNHGRASDVARKHYDRAQYTTAKLAVAEAIDRIMIEAINYEQQ